MNNGKHSGVSNKAITIIAGLMMLYGAGGMEDYGKNFYVGLMIFIAGFAVLMAVCILPFLSSRSKKRKVSKKYLRYSSVIGQYRRTPLKMLADELKTSEKNVKLEIQEMVFDGYLKDAYVDQDSEELVIPANTMIREKKIRCPRCSAEIKDVYNYCPMCGHSRFAEETNEQEKNHEQVRMYLGMIDSVKLFSANQELLKCTAYFSELVNDILKRTEDKPELMGNRDIRNLYNLYLPKIAGAIEDYKEMLIKKIPAEKRLALEDDLCKVFYKENMALVEITNKLNDDDILDISSEIDAIEEKLARDGY